MTLFISSISTKMAQGEGLDRDSLHGEAMNICSTMKDNPLFV